MSSLAVATPRDLARPSPAWLDRDAYPFAHRFRAVPGGSLHYLDEGAGEPIVFSHGTPTWSFEWRHVVRALAGEARCVAPDHLGFGLSERPRGADYSPEAHAQRFEAFVESLDLEPFTLVVHDYGGPIALAYALKHPSRVRRLVVINSWMWPFDDDPRMHRIARMAGSFWMRLLYTWANASLRLVAPSAYGDRAKLTKEIYAQYLAPFRDRWARREVLWALAKALGGSRDHYASLWARREALAAIPTLVVWGMKDGAFRPDQLERWALAAPHARVVRVEGAGHWPHEEEPDRVIEAVRAFVRS